MRRVSVGDVTSDESSDGELPPPADPDAPMGINGNQTSDKIDLMATSTEDKEEKKVRERASKLEFKRLDELYVSSKPSFTHQPIAGRTGFLPLLR